MCLLLIFSHWCVSSKSHYFSLFLVQVQPLLQCLTISIDLIIKWIFSWINLHGLGERERENNTLLKAIYQRVLSTSRYSYSPRYSYRCSLFKLNRVVPFKNCIPLLLGTLSWISNSISNSTYWKINIWYYQQNRLYTWLSSSLGIAITSFLILSAKALEASMTLFSQSQFTYNQSSNVVGSTLKIH